MKLQIESRTEDLNNAPCLLALLTCYVAAAAPQIDVHSEDPTSLNPTLFVHRWADLMSRSYADPPSRQRVMVDILNEPDARGIGWDTLTVGGNQQCM